MIDVLWWVLGGMALLYIVQSVYLGVILRWEDEQTNGLGYYGRTAKEREEFKRALRRHAILLSPILWINGKAAKLDFRKASIHHKGIAGPGGSCTAQSFARGESYKAKPDDIFVVTQMKCGTTWMQNIVYEVLHRGDGNLADTGATMYSVSPWLEGLKSVSLEKAPRLGTARPSRIIKTHFPARLCPSHKDARYIYVARHPVSCYASCVDFVKTNVGRMAPPAAAFEEWFTSAELMWWGTWPEHVRGWWERSKREPNVLLVYFEEMKQDLPAVVKQVNSFLGLPALGDNELKRVVDKCSFEYMQQHKDNFEMQPPHILQTNAALFVSGTADRHTDVSPDVRRRLMVWSARGLEGSDFPVQRQYPDIRAPASA